MRASQVGPHWAVEWLPPPVASHLSSAKCARTSASLARNQSTIHQQSYFARCKVCTVAGSHFPSSSTSGLAAALGHLWTTSRFSLASQLLWFSGALNRLSLLADGACCLKSLNFGSGIQNRWSSPDALHLLPALLLRQCLIASWPHHFPLVTPLPSPLLLQCSLYLCRLLPFHRHKSFFLPSFLFPSFQFSLLHLHTQWPWPKHSFAQVLDCFLIETNLNTFKLRLQLKVMNFLCRSSISHSSTQLCSGKQTDDASCNRCVLTFYHCFLSQNIYPCYQMPEVYLEKMLWVWIFLLQKLIKAIALMFSSNTLTYLIGYFLNVFPNYLPMFAILCDTFSSHSLIIFSAVQIYGLLSLFVFNPKAITVFLCFELINKQFLSLISFTRYHHKIFYALQTAGNFSL